MNNKFGIPEKFYKEGKHPRASTVKELMEILLELPENLPIKSGSAVSIECIVYNINFEDRHLCFSELWDE